MDADTWLKIWLGAATIFALPLGRWIFVQVRVWRHAKRNEAQLLGLLPAQLNELSSKVTTILAETHPNHGSSIRDSLNRIEATTRMQEQRWRALMSDMKLGVFETDARGNLTWSNRALLRITRRSFAELEGFGWFGSVAPQQRNAIRKECLSAFGDQREIEVLFDMAVNGRMQSVNMRNFRLRGAVGEVLGYINIIEPIEEPVSGS